MADEDPIDDLHGATTMAMMSAARASETLLRASQSNRSSQLEQTSRDTAAAQERYETQARVAEQFYARASTPEFARGVAADTVATAWRGAQQWRDLEEARFGPHADRMTASIREVYDLDPSDPAQLDQLSDSVRARAGVDADLKEQRQDDEVDREADAGVAAGMEYDSDAARKARTEQIERSDFHPEVKTAMKVADNQNGRDPAEAASSGGRAPTERRRKRFAGRDRTSDQPRTLNALSAVVPRVAGGTHSEHPAK